MTTTKNKKEGKNSTERETKLIVLGEGGGQGRRENWEHERVRKPESLKPQTFKHAVITQHKPGVSIQPTAITQRRTVIK